MKALAPLQKYGLAIAASGAGFLVVWLIGNLSAADAPGGAAAKSYIRLAMLAAAAVAVGFLWQGAQGQRGPDRIADEAHRILEIIPGLAWTADTAGRLTGMNAAFRDYLDVSDTASFRGREAIHPDDFEGARELWLQCLKTGEEFHSTHRVRGRDGTYRWFRAVARPRRDEGNVVGWYGTLIDIDDQKVAEQTLRASETALRSILEALFGDHVVSPATRANPSSPMMQFQ